MIVRALVRLASLAALAAAGWWLAKALRRAGRGERRDRPSRAKAAGAMVRDRECNTFLPRERALELHAGGQTHYFCSEACRDRFLSRSGTAASA
jgi:hypothetical protein